MATELPKTARPRTIPSKEWQALKKRFPKHPALTTDTLYALPWPLVEAIESKAPNFFTEQEVDFERALGAPGATGFFRGRPFEHAALIATKDWAARREEYFADIENGLQTLETPAGPKAMFSGAMRSADKAMDELANAYAGWLVVNPAFREEVEVLRNELGAQIEQSGGFPPYPSWPYEKERSRDSRKRKWEDDLFDFYDRWSLRGMASWELPLPMFTTSMGGTNLVKTTLSTAGLNVFVPWYLLSKNKLTLRDIATQKLALGFEPHLNDWFENRTKTGSSAESVGEFR